MIIERNKTENYTGENFLDELTLNWYLNDVVRIKSW